MSIDKATVAKIAHLARIEVGEARQQELVGELNKLLEWVDQLREVNTDNVAPMTSVVEAALPRRADIVTDGNYVADVLANAPDAEHGFFAVPKVIE
jgi:aspartyl-tRNA(Asn)/glutamyl-tRNA(Gln) amidotransferase subunit C